MNPPMPCSSWRPAVLARTTASGGTTRSKEPILFAFSDPRTGGRGGGRARCRHRPGKIHSRTIRPGQLYVFRSDRPRLHPAALEAGAPAYLTAQEPVGGTAIRVRDTAAACCASGRWPAVGSAARLRTTGSVGKTTTKDLLACPALTFRIAASERSFNNELGLPLTLLNAPEDARARAPDGVRRLQVRAAGRGRRRPDVGVVTSVEEAHVEYLGDIDGVARAKGELVPCRHRVSRLLNIDHRDGVAQRVPRAGVCGRWRRQAAATDVTLDRDLRARFRLSSRGARPTSGWRCTACSSPQRAGRGDGRAAGLLGPDRDRGRGAGGAPGLALRMEVHHVPAAPSWSSTVSMRSPRRPRRPCARWPRSRANASWQSSGSWPSWGAGASVRASPIAVVAEELGIRAVDTRPASMARRT